MSFEVLSIGMLAARLALCCLLAARAGYVWARPARLGLPHMATLALAQRARTWALLGTLGGLTQALRIGHPPDMVTAADATGTLWLVCVVGIGLSQMQVRP